MPDELELGPVDFLLLEFPQQGQTGRAAAELRALVEAGTIRLFDIVALHKGSDQEFTTFDLAELSTGDDDGFAFFAGARSGLLSDDDIKLAAETLKPGTRGVLLVFENAWAEGFISGVRSSGGSMVASSRISAQDLLDVLDTGEEETSGTPDGPGTTGSSGTTSSSGRASGSGSTSSDKE